MQETRVLVETKGTTGEETTSYWFDLPIDVAEFEEKLGVGAESGDYRIIEKVLPYADEVHEHTSVYQLNEIDFMYRQLSSDMQEEYTALLTVYENLEALYICRNVITVYPDCKSMIDVAKQKLMNDPTFKHLSEDCQEYYFDFRYYCMAVMAMTFVLGTSVTAFAANDPIQVVNNLSDFIFGLVRAVGMIMLGFGIVQIGLSLKSHDPSQRANGFLTLAGGVVITFAKEILTLITG